MNKNCAVILAAGDGKRMKSDLSKVLSKVLFVPMIDWVANAVKASGISEICIVTGFAGEQVKSHMGESFSYAVQEHRLGTGHAVMQALDFIKKSDADNVLILNGDAPLIDADTIRCACREHMDTNSAITLVSASVPDPAGYGRVIRSSGGKLVRVAEHRDATPDELTINEVNSGLYWFKKDDLIYALSQMKPENDQGEYYLTDAVGILIAAGLETSAYKTLNSHVVLGANDRVQLMQLNEIARMEVLHRLMISGVDIPCTDGIIISDGVPVGLGSTILPNTILRGKTQVGSNCTLGPNCLIENCIIQDNVKLCNVQAENSTIKNSSDAGPFAHIRPGCEIGPNVHIGNFVEVKNSVLDDGSKVPHLTYIGDSDIGRGVNFGCGSLTVNYDGKNKHRTTIKDRAFIGCNTNLLAPVTVGEFAFIAAGSTISDDVPPFALAIARGRQTNKENWVAEKKPYKNMD
ncbi:MAG: bifunctional UDP-N-acetylglucosamine diphosphorylase/glucosamine-1-phosphate N-acetyltransferase GlmU [Oscillospiraceae bacterium]|jgi:bifunctional UDP-N-acetylglucosamine pyrophosphorylase/glucosamine-1-phosphate N-acetyltransferase|nr:bifunctional UDP-N-acetylglucosamine diphosphorylase/glucosamine-1-phosphate N-acetyltransferase GlmU [Oscillospiraceae bacterium]